MREEFLWIEGPLGRMPAILHWPAVQLSESVCVVMFNAGQIGRAGPQRLYVNAARRWALSGIMCLRLDLAGVGDSPSRNDERHFDGHRVEEAVAAVEYVAKRLVVATIYVQGLCAGARVALKCAAEDDRVLGVIAWSCPVLSSSPTSLKSPYEDADAVSNSAARDILLSGLDAVLRGRILRPSFWGRRASQGRAEIRHVARAVRQLARPQHPKGNPFLDAVDHLLRGGRNVLFVYGQKDALPLGEFRDQYANIPQGSSYAQCFQIIPNATHTFNALSSQQEVIEISMAWLLQAIDRSGSARLNTIRAETSGSAAA